MSLEGKLEHCSDFMQRPALGSYSVTSYSLSTLVALLSCTVVGQSKFMFLEGNGSLCLDILSDWVTQRLDGAESHPHPTVKR